MKKNFDLNFKNFKAEDVNVEETINLVFIRDVSPSMNKNNAIGELDKAYNNFIKEMKESKNNLIERLMVSDIEFNENINIIHGFRRMVDVDNINSITSGFSTALYDAVYAGIKNAMEYREQLENSGVTCKTLVFIITDGEDMCSEKRSSEIKKMIDEIMGSEKNMLSFTTILFGIGNKNIFENAQKEMGIQNLATLNHTAKDIKKMIDFISQSVSKSSSGKPISTIDF
jgi:uncharacterized protein YegL